MRVWLIIIFFLSVPAAAQENKPVSPVSGASANLHYYFTLYSQADGKLAPDFEELKGFVQKMDIKRNSFKSQKAFLHFLFLKTHQRFFHNYVENASFSDLLRNGTYNCLGGTALYALLLKHYRIEFSILESNYHIFLLAQTEQGPVLIESTDIEKGFLDNREQIHQRIEQYRKQDVQAKNVSSLYFRYSKPSMDTVSLTGMLGLLHYNHAVDAYNSHQVGRSITHLHHAFLLHRSPMLEEFCKLLMATVTYQQNLDEEKRTVYLSKLQSLMIKTTRAADQDAQP